MNPKHTSSTDTTRSHGRRALVLWLVMALLLAQTLGFIHRVVHPGGHSTGHAGVLQSSTAARTGAAHAQGMLDALFQHGQDTPSCRIFDQSSGGDTLACVPAVVLPMAVSSFVLLYFQGEVLARWVALFDARGPPSVR